MNELQKLGSQIAKNGFQNERDVVNKFNNWKMDLEAQSWLNIMKYDLNNIEYVKATILSGHKADINIKIQIRLKDVINIENIQVKLVSNLTGFNQIDKRYLKQYKEMWNIPEDVYKLFAYFTGELQPYRNDTKDKRRMFITEFTELEKQCLLEWIDNNKLLIVTDILKGRGIFSAEWVLVVQKVNKKTKWVLKNINIVIQHYFNDGKVLISPRGSILIGKITVQRKGGDAGRNTANMLQFKLNPAELFNIE